MKSLCFAVLGVALTSPTLSAQDFVPPECENLAHPQYDDCVAAGKNADHDAAEKQLQALPPETQKRVMESLNRYRVTARWDRLTTAELHEVLAEIKRENNAKAAKEKSAQARKKADQEAIRKHPDKDPKWLLSKAGRVWRQNPSWSIADCNRIGEEKVWIGMTAEQVLASWGKPQHINSDISASGTREQWVYGSGDYLYVVSGKVTHLQIRR